MKYNELKTTRKTGSKRVGRGISSGYGKTAGRGTKGQNARTGGRVRPGFEGGQNPFYKRLPKLRGFKSHKRAAENIYTFQLDALSSYKIIDNKALADAGLIGGPYLKVKLVTKGSVEKKHTVKLQGASASAIEAVQKSGGSFEKIPTPMRPSNKNKEG